MTIKQINEIIENGDYSMMLRLYLEHKPDAIKDDFFKSVTDPEKDSIHYTMLMQQCLRIRKILLSNNTVETNQAISVKDISKNTNSKTNVVLIKDRPEIKKNPYVNYDKLPKELKALYDQNGRFESENKTLFAEMKVTGTDVRRKFLLDKIIANEEKQRANWDVIDNWYKQIKAEPAATDHKTRTEQTGYQISKEIDAAKNYIRRYSKSETPEVKQKVLNAWKVLKKHKVDWKPKSAADKK